MSATESAPTGEQETGRSSFTVTRNTKGFGFAVKVYASSNEPEDIEAAAQSLHGYVADFTHRYPASV